MMKLLTLAMLLLCHLPVVHSATDLILSSLNLVRALEAERLNISNMNHLSLDPRLLLKAEQLSSDCHEIKNNFYYRVVPMDAVHLDSVKSELLAPERTSIGCANHTCSGHASDDLLAMNPDWKGRSVKMGPFCLIGPHLNRPRSTVKHGEPGSDCQFGKTKLGLCTSRIVPILKLGQRRLLQPSRPENKTLPENEMKVLEPDVKNASDSEERKVLELKAKKELDSEVKNASDSEERKALALAFGKTLELKAKKGLDSMEKLWNQISVNNTSEWELVSIPEEPICSWGVVFIVIVAILMLLVLLHMYRRFCEVKSVGGSGQQKNGNEGSYQLLGGDRNRV